LESFCLIVALLSLGDLKASAQASGGLSAGFLYDQFNLTLEAGRRTEAMGPFFYSEKKEDEGTLAFPPFYSRYRDTLIDSGEDDFLYPLLTYEYYGDEWRWQFFQLIAFAGGRQPDEFHTRQFTLFPIYFQQRSQDPKLNYTALVPFYGHLQNRLFRDKIFFVLFPIYGQSQKRDIVTDNYLYPIVHVRHGNGLHGWQVWPIVGREHKDVTAETNGFGDVTVIGGHDQSFWFWPFWFKQNNDLGTENPVKFRASIPFFVTVRSPLRDQTSVLWPFFTKVDERGRHYREWEEPWPFIIFARGEGKTTSRVWPIYSQSHDAVQESDSYLWPIYRYKWYHAGSLDERRTSIAFYLYVDVKEKNTATGAVKRRVGMWPFFQWQGEFNGNERLQILTPLEVILPDNRGIVRNWSPIWSLWHDEKNPRAGLANESLLWNLYRRETGPGHKKISLLFGLFQYQRDGAAHETRLFYLPISRTRAHTQ
jgi:hypothetical protein